MIFYTEEDEQRTALAGRTGVRFCHPKDVHSISRRQFLNHGSYLAAFLGTGALFKSNRLLAAEATTVQKRLVWIMMGGGWDILEVTDPKIMSTPGIDMTYSFFDAQQIAGAGNGDRIGRFLPRTAALGQDLIAIRGLTMGTTSHTAGAVYMDTGVLSNSGDVNVASIPAIIASQSNATLPLIQLQGGMDVLTDRATSNVSVVRAQNLDLYRAMYPASGAELEQKLRVLDHLKASAEDVEKIIGANDRLTAIQTAEAKIRVQFENDVRSKLELTDEDIQPFSVNAPSTLSDGERDSFAMALKLLNNDLATSINMGMGGYDTHSNQLARIGPNLTNFDYLLSTLANQLKAANKLQDTLIVVISDFGRTPKVNGGNGRDHWPVGGALMVGGNIDGGRIVGATDDNLRSLAVNAATGLVDENGELLSSKHLGGSVVSLCLGEDFFSQKRAGYLYSIEALTRLRSS